MVLIAKKQPNYRLSSYSTPLVNLSSAHLILEKMFKFGLQRDFVDKNKNIKKYLAVSFGSLADKIADNLASNEHKDFHEFP